MIEAIKSTTGKWYLVYAEHKNSYKVTKITAVSARKSIVQQVVTQLQIECPDIHTLDDKALLADHYDLLKTAERALSHNIHPLRIAEYFSCAKSGTHFYF